MIQLRFRPFLFLLLFLVILLQYKLWFEPGGVIQMLHLRKQIATQETVDQKLHQRNATVLAQVQSIQQGNQVIEGHARHDLGMVKKDETFYQVVNDKEKNH